MVLHEALFHILQEFKVAVMSVVDERNSGIMFYVPVHINARNIRISMIKVMENEMKTTRKMQQKISYRA